MELHTVSLSNTNQWSALPGLLLAAIRRKGPRPESPSDQFWTKHPMSLPSSPEEEAPSSLEVQEHPSSSPMSPAAPTPEVPKTSDRTQVEAKEVRLSDMPPVMLDDTDVQTELRGAYVLP